MIVLWGLRGDGPFDAVRAALAKRRANVAFIDQRLLLETSVELALEPEPRVTVALRGERFELARARSVYFRTYDLRRLPAVLAATSTEGAIRAGTAIEQALVSWLELSPARVLNRPSNMASNNSKPYQMELLREHGFSVPRTLVTTDPDAVRDFWTECGSVIYKSVSGVRSVVARLSDAHADRLEQVTICPTQFQQYVPGRDHRVHVVGDEVFASEVISEADDYRYAARRGAPPTLRACTLPLEVAERCITLAHALGLPFAGIDLRRAPNGRWYCFEVNPSPGFTYYEAHTGQPIADAVASYLDSAPAHRDPTRPPRAEPASAPKLDLY